MPKATSTEWRQWVKEYDADDPMIILIELTHPNIDGIIRISSDMTEFYQLDPESQEPVYGTTHNGNKYYCLPFSFTIPDQPDDSDATVKAQIQIDNVNRDYVEAVRNMDIAPTLVVKFVLKSSVNVVQQQMPSMRIKEITYDAALITGEIEPDDYRIEPFPSPQFYPSRFPGLFS